MQSEARLTLSPLEYDEPLMLCSQFQLAPLHTAETDEARFTLAATAEEIMLASAPTASDTLLPPDLGYEAADLGKAGW